MSTSGSAAAADSGHSLGRRPSLPLVPSEASPSASSSSQSPGSRPRPSRPAFTTSLSDFALPSPRATSPSLLSQQARIAPPILTSGYGYSLRPRSSLARSVVSAQQEEDSDAEAPSPVGRDSSSAARRRDNLQRAGLTGSSRRDKEEDGESGGDERRGSITTRTWSSEHSSGRNSGSRPSLSPRLTRAQHRVRAPRDRQSSPASRRPVSPDSVDSPYQETKGDGAEDVDIDFDLDGMDMRMTDCDEVPSTVDPSVPLSQAGASTDDMGAITASMEPSPSPPPPLRRRSSADNPVPAQAATARRASMAPPLLRVMSLLRDESRPSESEVASEAKLTRRLGHEAEILEYRREREASPFPSNGRHLLDAHVEPRKTSGGMGFPSSDYSLHMDDEESMSDGKVVSGAPEEDGLLDNVGFESDHTTSEGSELLSPPIEPNIAAPFLRDNYADLIDAYPAVQRYNDATVILAQEESGADTRMDAEEDDNSKTADAANHASTPPASALQRSGAQQTGHERSSSYPNADSVVSQSASKTGTPTRDATPPALSTSTHRRMGSAWTDFRNSPSPATGTVAVPLEKRHHHRVHNGSFHRTGNGKTDREGNASKLSTSPASGSGHGSTGVIGGNAVESILSSSPGPLPPSVRSKRKFGPEERFEPYASSVYKRRAVSPLTGLSLPLSGLGTFTAGAIPTSLASASAATSTISSNVTGGSLTGGSPLGTGGGGYPYYRSSVASNRSPPIGGRDRDGGYFGRKSVGATIAPSTRGIPSAAAAVGAGSGSGTASLSRSPTTRPSTPLVGPDGSGSMGAAMASYYGPSSPPTSSHHYHRAGGPPMPMPIGLGLGAGGALLGSSPKSSGSGPGYGSGGLGLSIAANSRDDFDGSLATGSPGGEMSSGSGSGRRSRMGSPVASRKRGFPGSGELTPGAVDRLMRGYGGERDKDKGKEREKSKQGGEEMEGGVERMVL